MPSATRISRSIALIGLLTVAVSTARAQNAPAPTHGQGLQALSCTNTIPTAAPKGPRQPLFNCTGDFFTPFDGELLNFYTHKLERVIVNGRSTSPWRTLCIGQECADLLGDEAVATRINDRLGGGFEQAMAILRKVPIKLSACSVFAKIPDDAKTITSHDEQWARTYAAGQIIEAFIKGGNFPNVNKTEVLITFSDNGTQSFIFNTGNPAAPTHKDDLKKGDGKPKCS